MKMKRIRRFNKQKIKIYYIKLGQLQFRRHISYRWLQIVGLYTAIGRSVILYHYFILFFKQGFMSQEFSINVQLRGTHE